MTTTGEVVLLPGVFQEMCKGWDKYLRTIVLSDVPRGKEEETVEEIPVTTLPTRLGAISDWPKRTTVKCWNCARQVNNTTWYIPSPSSLLEPRGNFCHVPCIISWLESHPDWDTFDTRKQVKALIVARLGKTPRALLSSPAHTERVEFGGQVTDAEYEKEMLQKIKLMGLTCDRTDM